MGIYEKVPYVVGKGNSVLQCERKSDKGVKVQQNLPCNIIVIHGVNDVGTSYSAVEKGLCAGLGKRLGWQYVPGKYRLPTEADKSRLEEDPDDVFFKRATDEHTHSPVIPFYWGFRETREAAKVVRGQNTDRFGNRLDKDLSKEGGPFANATSSLPDMWNKGKSKALGILDKAQADATHPVLDNPGRMYMILAAKRLAALIAMIRDYDENEAVTLVAHSQGCMLSLLAQAFLLEDGLRPADTLILNNPPYSLVDSIPATTRAVEGTSGEDAAMAKDYQFLDGRQTMHACLQTLINIVHGVVRKKHASPSFTSLGDQCRHHGMVSAKWKAAKDRDNRGKVYLYFGPEDMTVSLNNVQGIGWQGVPDFQRGRMVDQVPETKTGAERSRRVPTGRMLPIVRDIVRQPMKEITGLNADGAGFYQRVFTLRLRPDPEDGAPVLIGQAKPHDYILRTTGEDDHAHTAVSDTSISKEWVRAHFPEPVDIEPGKTTVEQARSNIRAINGEPLPVPVKPSMFEGASKDAQGRPGAIEDVDPIDAAIAVTSDYGLLQGGVWELHPDPMASSPKSTTILSSPSRKTYSGYVQAADDKAEKLAAMLNEGKKETAQTRILHVYDCIGTNPSIRNFNGKVLVNRSETADEARLRWQKASGARSFHGAIFGGLDNHRQVTAYDVAIGGGKAATDPFFYQYLCAVADWRLQKGKMHRPSILKWHDFLKLYATFWGNEPQWRKELIEGTSDYYSTGSLPPCVPTLKVGLPSAVICETLNATSLNSTGRSNKSTVAGGKSFSKATP